MNLQPKTMNKLKNMGPAVLVAIALALITYAAYILVGINPDVLITAQDRNPFSGDSMYFAEHIARPFGLIEYIGGFLTQFFYYPAVGAGMLIAIWTAIAFAGVKAFGLKGIWCSLAIVPSACLLASVVDLGYWVYCLTLKGYWFSQSFAILTFLLLLWAANTTPRRFRIVWYVLVGFALFPFLGWMSYIFSVSFALCQFTKNDNKKTHPSWIDAVGVIVTFIAPVVFRALIYENLNADDVFNAGFPLFKTTTDTSLRPTIPFFIILGTFFVLSFGRVLPAMKKVPETIAYPIVGIASCVCVWMAMFRNDNYIYEMQMTQATMNDDWQGVIRVAEKATEPSRTMVILKNIALVNTGELATRSYELGNDGVEIYNPDSLNLSLMHIASPIVYYNHGEVNYALRWCMEFSVPYGFSPFYLKTMARCAEATGEKNLARRYISRLHSLLFYKDWKPAPVTPVVKDLQNVFPDSLNNDENNCERYLIGAFSSRHNTKSAYYSDLSLLYSMIVCTPQDYWMSLHDYMSTHKGNTLPAQYEEAYCLFMDQSPAAFPIKVSVSPSTLERYKGFLSAGNGFAECGMDENGVREAMRSDWGHTYWWSNAFGRHAY